MENRELAYLYTRGRFVKTYGKILDADNEYLYEKGKYPSKIKREDLPEDYIEIRSKSIWNMIGYLKTSGIRDIKYKAMKNQYLLKDDCLYISYDGKIKKKMDCFGFVQFENYDICICGDFILDIVLAAEKYSGVDIQVILEKMDEKRKWLKENYGEEKIGYGEE